MPFYRRLSKLREQSGDLGLVIVSPDPLQETNALLRDQGVMAVKVVEAPLASIGVSSTPTLLVVDSTGVVRDVVVGKLPAVREQQFIDTLTVPR
jgi:hypothetical protein